MSDSDVDRLKRRVAQLEEQLATTERERDDAIHRLQTIRTLAEPPRNSPDEEPPAREPAATVVRPAMSVPATPSFAPPKEPEPTPTPEKPPQPTVKAEPKPPVRPPKSPSATVFVAAQLSDLSDFDDDPTSEPPPPTEPAPSDRATKKSEPDQPTERPKGTTSFDEGRFIRLLELCQPLENAPIFDELKFAAASEEIVAAALRSNHDLPSLLDALGNSMQPAAVVAVLWGLYQKDLIDFA